MTLERAVEILELHQKWRLGEIDEMPCEPSELTEALNIAITNLHSIKELFLKKEKTNEDLILMRAKYWKNE